MRFIAVLAACLVAAGLNFLFWWQPGQPRPLSQPFAGKLDSVSFAPYRRHQSPLTRTFASQAEIDADLRLVSQFAKGVRTYTTREGLEVVPTLAEKYGLEVTLGAWLGQEIDINNAEIAAVIAQANAHPNSVKRIIVGNEVLLRRDLPRDELIQQIRRVKQAVKQPVSYADVWEFWLRNPQVAQEVDYITVHMLPYWEDEPVDVANTMKHIEDVLGIVQRAFPGKPILIGEVGWPSGGRARERAQTGLWMEAEFLSRFANLAAQKGIAYNVVEAFDQVWKSAHEGLMGAKWGLFDADRQPKFSLAGPVADRANWLDPLVYSSILALILVIWSLRTPLAAPAAGGVVLLAQALATMAAVSAVYGLDIWQSRLWLAAPLFQFALQALLALCLFREAVQRLAKTPSAVRVRSPMAVLDHWRSSTWRDRLLLLFALLAAYETVLLAVRPDLPAYRNSIEPLPGLAKYWLFSVFNGRYREFPLPEFLVPVLGTLLFLALLSLFGRKPLFVGGRGVWLDRVIAVILALAVPLMLWSERWINGEAALWGLTAAAFALLALAGLLSSRRVE